MKLPQLLAAGWRVFFLSAGLFGAGAMLLWLHWLTAGDSFLPFDRAPQMWHAHEMIFGFAGAALGGFFLTAVPNWTGARAAPRRFILMVSALWLAGRVAVGLAGWLPPVLVALVDLAFLPVLGAKILTQLLARPKPQNMMFLLMLTLTWLGDLLVHLDWIGLTQTESQGLRGGMLAICAMIATLGGRVTPAFTRNALVRAGQEARLPVSRPRLDMAGIALAILTAASVLAGAPDGLSGGLAVAAGVVAALRLAGWRGLALPGQPIVWALHLGYAMLALGLVMWGASLWGLGSETGALHVLAIGAIGGMTLAVMSRAALGHSGRDLVAPWPVALGYAALPVAVLLRWLASVWVVVYWPAIIASGVIWVLVFAGFTLTLWPVFMRPRIDGKEG
ncbi:NnrS family protein [Paracoccus jiaweipingae]|uniref:NnrS family protein n=1 Tax=unclassified Paracoccus (in: a-proteobacteria) TaxID=2688777 RepID=UPI00379B6FA4